MKTAALLVAATLLSLSGARATPPLEYPWRIRDLGAAASSRIADLNRHRDACVNELREGEKGPEPHALAYAGGQFMPLCGPDTERATVSAINDAGQIVGSAETASGAWHAFIWQDLNGDDVFDRNDPQETVDLGAGRAEESFATGINNQGQVTGYVQGLPHAVGPRAFRWDNGRCTLLRMLGAKRSRGEWIGPDGTIVGVAATLRGSFRPMRWGRGGLGTFLPINSRLFAGSTVAGESSGGDVWLTLFGGISGSEPAVLRNGRRRPALLPHSGDDGFVNAVTRRGMAVGGASRIGVDSNGTKVVDRWPMFWQVGRGGGDVNRLVKPGGLRVESADCINEGADIGGTAVDSEGLTHLVLVELIR